MSAVPGGSGWDPPREAMLRNKPTKLRPSKLFYEDIEHPILGRRRLPSPFRFHDSPLRLRHWLTSFGGLVPKNLLSAQQPWKFFFFNSELGVGHLPAVTNSSKPRAGAGKKHRKGCEGTRYWEALGREKFQIVAGSGDSAIGRVQTARLLGSPEGRER